MKLEDFNIYIISMEVAHQIWNIASKWSHFERHTLGTQLIRAADSIAANTAEGFGRFTFRERIQYCYYSRGSLFETKVWLQKVQIMIP